MKKQNKDNEITIKTHTASYAWVTYPSFGKKDIKPSEIFCAWCNKSQEEIGLENCNAHIEQHAEEDKKK